MFPLYFFTKTLDFFNIIVYNRYVYIFSVAYCTCAHAYVTPENTGTEMKKERRYIHV